MYVLRDAALRMWPWLAGVRRAVADVRAAPLSGWGPLRGALGTGGLAVCQPVRAGPFLSLGRRGDVAVNTGVRGLPATLLRLLRGTCLGVGWPGHRLSLCLPF